MKAAPTIISPNPGMLNSSPRRWPNFCRHRKRLESMNTKNSILSALDLARTGESPAGEAPVVLAVDRLFELALVQRASDIHLEPQVRGLFVRFRVDGMLRTIHEYPITAAPAIVSRIKIMASMDIAEKRLPQDGQTRAQIGKRDIEFRISTLSGT